MPLQNICVIKYYKVQFHWLSLIFMKGKCFQLRQVNQAILWTWITYPNAQGRGFWKQIPAIRAASGTGNVLRTIGSVCYWGDEGRRSSESLRPSAKLGGKPRGTCQPKRAVTFTDRETDKWPVKQPQQRACALTGQLRYVTIGTHVHTELEL